MLPQLCQGRAYAGGLGAELLPLGFVPWYQEPWTLSYFSQGAPTFLCIGEVTDKYLFEDTVLGSGKGWTQRRAYSLSLSPSLSQNLCLTCSGSPSLSVYFTLHLSFLLSPSLACHASELLSVSESLCASLFVSHGSLCLLNLKISSISCFSASECLRLCVSAFLSPALFSLLPQSLSL